MLTPDGILMVLAIVIGVAWWRHKRRKPARPLSRDDLDHYQG
jgi:hypothetical protein